MNLRRYIRKTILIAALLMVAFQVLQAQDLNRRITIRASGEKPENILKEIGRQGQVHFSYNPRIFKSGEKTDLTAVDQTIGIALEQLLTPLGITYTIAENQVILRRIVKEGMTEKSGIRLNPKFTISGFIRDITTGEVLIGVNVYDKTSYKGTTSNAYGFYSLTLQSDNYQLAFSLVGYSQLLQQVSLDKDRTMNISMTEASIYMKEVEIVSGKESTGIDPAAAGEVRLSSQALKRMAGFAGNLDVLKSLQSVPGINAFGDGSSFFYVRGGNNDQNLLLIDEAPIFNPSHLFGFFSALAPDAIKDVKAYKGDFPASFGGRLSSVIDIRARDGNLNRLGFSGNLGIFTSDLTIEGPLVKEKSSFILSGRRSNLNWLSNNNNTGKAFTIGFYDLNGKINLRLNAKNRLFFTGFTGKDDFSRITNASIHTFGISWDNSTATIRWNHLFNNRLFSNTTAVFSEYNYYLYISREEDDYWHSAIRNKTLKSDLTWYMNPSNTIKAGAELSNYYSNPGNVHFSDEETQRNAPKVPGYNSLNAGIYLSNEQLIKERLMLKYGIRLSSWWNYGPATVFFYDAGHNVSDTIEVAKGSYHSPRFNAEPRISVSYNLGKEASLTAGYCRTVQYLQMLSNSTSPFTSLEVWAPSGPNIKPQQADQFTLGFITKSPRTDLNFSFEVFYKQFHNQIEYKDHANMLYNSLIEGELRFGKAKSYGAEFLLRRSKGRFNGWIGYAYSRVLKKFDEINHGLEYAASYDHPHTLFANLILKAGKRWDFAANWSYMTGAAFSSPTGFMQYNGYTIPIYGKKNNDRLPDYHRLDVSVTLRLNKQEKRFKHNLIFSVYNLYGRANPFSVSFNKIMNDNGDFVVPSDLSGSYEIIPTSISVAGMIPSLNYTFRF
ncbi:MAG: TonB-dependent receptor [Bacteroidales bacterium]|nr:TonB-dependent receptor [Bacteroidales bacterium]